MLKGSGIPLEIQSGHTETPHPSPIRLIQKRGLKSILVIVVGNLQWAKSFSLYQGAGGLGRGALATTGGFGLLREESPLLQVRRVVIDAQSSYSSGWRLLPKTKGEKVKKFILAALLAFSTVSIAYAHSGGTDSTGCHRDHQTGGRHCH
jgi:hypothetical protein